MFIFHFRTFSVHQQRYIQINGASCFHEIQKNVLWVNWFTALGICLFLPTVLLPLAPTDLY